MANTRISAVDTTDMTNQRTVYSVSSAEQDAPGANYYPPWSKWYGYYKTIPELQAVIDKKAVWTIGKGFKSDERVKKILSKIRGNGKDTFNSIMHNMVRQYTICGDAFAEIIKNKRGEIINLKPLNPGYMLIRSNTKGIIIGYEQVIPLGGKNIPLAVDKIFHLAWNRLGDEVHGISTVQKIENIILMKNEAQSDMKTVFHRYVSPLLITKVDTDDATEIADLKTKLDRAVAKGENLIVPLGTVETMERIAIPQYSTLDPLPWIKLLQEYFIVAEGVPEVILGYGRETTEASSKILYLAFQQNIEHNQLFLEEQIKAQLGLDVEFNFPENIAPDLAKDQQKDGSAFRDKEDKVGV